MPIPRTNKIDMRMYLACPRVAGALRAPAVIQGMLANVWALSDSIGHFHWMFPATF